MPQLSSPLTTPTGIPLLNAAHIGKAGGVPMHFGTFAAFTAAVTQERTDGLWADGQPITVASEAASNVQRVWSLASQHARTVRIGLAQLVLAADANVVLAASGAPSGGTGANGDIAVDWAVGAVYLKGGGAWALTASTKGVDVAVAAAVVSNVVNFSVPENTLTPGANVTLTFGGSPVTGQFTALKLTGDGTARTITLPANVRSEAQQATVASFVLPVNYVVTIVLKKTAAGYDMYGEPVPLADRGISGRFATGANDTQVLTPYAVAAGVINRFYTRAASGTATYQLAINGTNVTGGLNSVSTAAVNNTSISGQATIAIGDAVAIVRTANASAVDVDWVVGFVPARA